MEVTIQLTYKIGTKKNPVISCQKIRKSKSFYQLELNVYSLNTNYIFYI